MSYEEIMAKYIRVDVPLEKMRRRVHRRMNEIETITGEEENTLKQMNMYRIFYTILTIIAIIVLIISVNFKIK